MSRLLAMVGLALTLSAAWADEPYFWDRPDWSASSSIDGESRANIFQIEDPKELEAMIKRGKEHALIYPVEVTGLLVPYRPIKYFFDGHPNPIRDFFFRIGRQLPPFKSTEDLYDWLGLHPYPKQAQAGIYQIPYPKDQLQGTPMGFTYMNTDQGGGFTFSCATCHAGNLFGTKVLGLNNRFPRANDFFHLAKRYIKYVGKTSFRLGLGATHGEAEMFGKIKKNIKYVGTKSPVTLGLDTSLAQVALSLARREQDPYATKNPMRAYRPRQNPLGKKVADSKPMPWFTLKYKTRWLSDGSIRSGNPVFTNFLWNEIGRATELRELEVWMRQNKQKIAELTAAVFATKAPQYTDFFPAEDINLASAMRGEELFNNNCMKCHGKYEKGWSLDNADALSLKEKLATAKVRYPKKTKVINVGTDPLRHQGMKHFADELNQLAISKWMETVVTPTNGYVPPPLNGIWARWPYFHNNSAPSLCAVLTAGPKRPKTYWAGEALDKERDFDQRCNGYPLGDKVPAEWKKNSEYLYDSTKPGLSNLGHDRRIFIKDGKEIFTADQKMDIIEYLKTL